MLLGCALGLLAIVLALLAIPLEVAVRLERKPVFSYEISLRALFGAVCASWRSDAPRIRAARARNRTVSRAVRKTRRRPGAALPRGLAVLRSKGLGAALIRLGARLMRGLGLQSCSLHARFGLEDPADTGQLCALLAPIGALVVVPRSRVELVPDFAAEVLEWRFTARARSHPLRLLTALLLFIVSPAVLGAGWNAWRVTRPRA